MSIARWNPLRELQEMTEAVDETFRRLRREEGGVRYWRMPADAYLTDDAIHLSVSLPGVDPDQVNITFENGVLTISGEYPAGEDGRNYLLRELPTGRFERVLSVSTPVDASKIEASFADGMLHLVLPKAEEVKPKTIAVKRA